MPRWPNIRQISLWLVFTLLLVTVSLAVEKNDYLSPRKIPTLMDLGANKCIPCKMMAPVLDELDQTYQDHFEVLFYDVWQDNQPARLFGVRMIPTQIFFDETGKELFRHEGYFSRAEILATWKKLGYKFPVLNPPPKD